MTHPGLPGVWVLVITFGSVIIATFEFALAPALGSIRAKANSGFISRLASLRAPTISSNWPLFTLKILMASIFVLIIFAGLIGTPIAERNIATVLTWNVWWAGLIVSVLFFGSSWCAICPWDAIATWLVRRRMWRRAEPNNSLNLRFPKRFRNSWLAMIMLITLTWLELGFGLTTDPYLTAQLALAMVVAATAMLAIFERKAFCRYVCPVGRTVGAYAQLAPVELRPIESAVCASCTTLECYHGNDVVDPCPTHLVMGSLRQNTYCTACGNCAKSCPSDNVAWRVRSPQREIADSARPHDDEAWFMLGLLSLTWFHGITMMSFYESWLLRLGNWIGDSGQFLASFTILMCGALALPVALFAVAVYLTKKCVGDRVGSYIELFSSFAFTALPLAFAYHLAHNLNHLVREAVGLGAIFSNPLGIGAAPLSMVEKHLRHSEILIPQSALFAAQSALILFGLWLSFCVIRRRSGLPGSIQYWKLAPMIGFAVLMTGLHCWLLSQPMTMRM